MIKKIIFYSLFASSIGLNAYLLTTEVEVVDNLDSELEEVKDRVAYTQSSISKKSLVKSVKPNKLNKIKKEVLSPKKNSRSSTDKLESDNEIQMDEVNYDRAMKEWKENTRSFMESELGIYQEQVDEYFMMVDNRNRDINEYIEKSTRELNASMDDEKGMLYLGLEQSIGIAKINERYINSLKRLLGPNAYDRYRQRRNEQLKQMIETGSPYVFSEF